MKISRMIKTLVVLAVILTYSLTAQQDPAGLVFPELDFTPPQPRYKKIKNGVELYYRENHDAPVIKVDLIFKSGTLNEPRGKEGLASIAFSLLKEGGTRQFNPEWINEQLHFLGSRITVAVGLEYSQISLWSLKKNFRQTWEFLTEMLRYPAFDVKCLDNMKMSRLVSLRRRWEHPVRIGYYAFNELVYGKNLDEVRWSTKKSIHSITRENVVSFYNEYIANSEVMAAVSGDFAPRELFATIKNTFSGRRVTPGEKNAPAGEIKSAEPGIYLVHSEQLTQTFICMGHPGMNRLDPDRAEINVLNYIYGTDVFNSRLGKELRAKRGLVYNVYGEVGKGRVRGLFQNSCMTKHETVGDVISQMRNIMLDITTNPITMDELSSALNHSKNSFVHLFEESHTVIIEKIIYKIWGYPSDYLETYLRQISSIDQQKILSMAKRTIHPDQLIILVVGNKNLVYKQLQELNLGPINELSI